MARNEKTAAESAEIIIGNRKRGKQGKNVS